MLLCLEEVFNDSIPRHCEPQVTLDQISLFHHGLVRAKPQKGLAFSFPGRADGGGGCVGRIAQLARAQL
jgi:hypothetical protein